MYLDILNRYNFFVIIVVEWEATMTYSFEWIVVTLDNLQMMMKQPHNAHIDAFKFEILEDVLKNCNNNLKRPK